MSATDKEALGQEFRRLRLDLGMTQVQAAEYCGVSKMSISIWENGHRQFNSKEQRALILQSLNKLRRRRQWRDRRT